MNRRLLGQNLWFWLIVIALFAVTQGAFYLGNNDFPILDRIAGDYGQRVIISASVMAIVSLGLNLIYGFNGQFSLGQWGFYALGAYAAADATYWWNRGDARGVLFLVAVVILLTAAYIVIRRLIRDQLHYMDEMSRFALYLISTVVAVGVSLLITVFLREPVSAVLGLLHTGSTPQSDLSMQLVFLIATLGGGALAALCSYLFGQPVLKLGGDYFGIATLGFTMVMYVLAQNADSAFPEMNGARGMTGIPILTNWPWIFAFLVLVIVLLRNMLDSSQGRAVISVREDEIAARAMGIDVTGQKTLAFVVGSFFAGIAGSLYAHQEGFLHPSTFYFVKAFDPLIIIVFGGLGSVTGTVIASFAWAVTLSYILPSILSGDQLNWRFVIYPVALLLIMLLRQQGLLGGTELGFLKPTKWPMRARQAAAGPPPGPGAVSEAPRPALAPAGADQTEAK